MNINNYLKEDQDLTISESSIQEKNYSIEENIFSPNFLEKIKVNLENKNSKFEEKLINNIKEKQKYFFIKKKNKVLYYINK